MIQRMIRAARLDARVYQELRDDPAATVRAFGVIVLASVALTGGSIMRFSREVSFGLLLGDFFRSLFSTVVEWFILSLLAYWIGKMLMRRAVTFPSLLRTLGFANVPWVFVIFIFTPAVGDLIVAAVLVWIVLALIVALRQTLQVSLWVSFPMSTFGIFIALNIRQLIAEALL